MRAKSLQTLAEITAAANPTVAAVIENMFAEEEIDVEDPTPANKKRKKTYEYKSCKKLCKTY